MRDRKLRDRKLRAGYRECARLTWRHGTTYYWGALLLRRERRRHVHAVYALCRLADDIVDFPESRPQLHETAEPASRYTLRQAQGTSDSTESRLLAFAASFRAAVQSGDSDDPVLAAVAHTVRTCEIEPECFDRFFGAMAMDLTTSTYETWEDLAAYMEGSAAVIGEMMLPILEPRDPAAYKPARALGLAFQLTNFLRDVDEDLDRGRVYMPQADLRRFGVDLDQRRVTPEWRAFLAYEIERNRALYAFADTGIKMLPPRSARCVGAARVLYAQILERIEKADYDVFTRRARVPTSRKAITAGRIMVMGPA